MNELTVPLYIIALALCWIGYQLSFGKLTGPAGQPGEKGERGEKGDPGKDGAPGKDGVILRANAQPTRMSHPATVEASPQSLVRLVRPDGKPGDFVVAGSPAHRKGCC